MRRGRDGDRYFAVFEYIVDNKVYQHTINENEGDYFDGEKYVIRYSIEYPGIFTILSESK